MKKSKEYKPAKDLDYARYMAEALKARPREKIPPTTQQAQSTQDVFSGEAANRPWPPKNWKANPNAKNTDELVGMRSFTPQEIAIHEDVRRKGRNSQGDAISQGASSATDEKKEAAINAFTYAPPIPLDQVKLEQLKALDPYQKVQFVPEAPKPKSLASRFFHWLWKKNVPIYKLTKKKLSVDEAEEL